MKIDAIQKIVKKLYELDSCLFFETKTNKEDIIDNKFVITIEKDLGEIPSGSILTKYNPKYEYTYYELKEEYKEKVTNLSLPEIISLLKLENNTDKNILAIKKWVMFFGILTIAMAALFAISLIIQSYYRITF